MNNGKVQINMIVPSEWKTELQRLARIYSIEEGEDLTHIDLIKRAIQEKYQLEPNDE